MDTHHIVSYPFTVVVNILLTIKVEFQILQ